VARAGVPQAPRWRPPVVLNGEGSNLPDDPDAIRELFLAWFAKERLGIRLSSSMGGALTDVVPVLPAMVRKTFQTLDAVAVRDPCSLRNVLQYAPDVPAQLLPDSAFVFNAAEARETQAVRAVRAWIGESPRTSASTRANADGPHHTNASALYQLISRLLRVAPRAVFVSSGPSDTYIRDIAAQTDLSTLTISTDYGNTWPFGDARFSCPAAITPNSRAIVGCPSITFASANHKVHGACEILDGLVGFPYDGQIFVPSLMPSNSRRGSYVANRDQLTDQLLDICSRRRLDALRLGELATHALADEGLVGGAGLGGCRP